MSNIPGNIYLNDLENFLIEAGIAEDQEDAFHKAESCLFSPDGNEFSVYVDGKGFGRVLDAFGVDFEITKSGDTWFVWTIPGCGEVRMTCTDNSLEMVVVKNQP